MRGDIAVDAALFLGMHSADEATRRACKAFFVWHRANVLVMPLEQVGRCDDVVWRFPRHVQDAYYPFLDTVHTELDVTRPGYDERDVRAVLGRPDLAGLPVHERLLVAACQNRRLVLYTASPRLRIRLDLARTPVPPDVEPDFDDPIEALYRRSLTMRLATADL